MCILNPLFSVVVPVYNAARYLRECLDSILCQNGKDVEVILVNDGSTDDSEAICIEYMAKDQRIRYVSILNSGVSVARNKGIEIAKGEYVLFCDSDDYYSPGFLNVLRPYAETRKYDVINFGHVVDKYENGVLIASYTRGIPNNTIIQSGEWKEKFRYYWNSDIGKLPVWDKAISRKFILENNIWFRENQEFYEDLLFNICVWSNAKEILLFDQQLYHFRTHAESTGVMRRGQDNFYSNIDYTARKYMEFLQREGIGEEDFPEWKDFVYGAYMMVLDRVKSGRADNAVVRLVVKQLFSNQLFLESSRKYIGKRLKLLKLLHDFRLDSLAVWYIRIIY